MEGNNRVACESLCVPAHTPVQVVVFAVSYMYINTSMQFPVVVLFQAQDRNVGLFVVLNI